MKKFLDRIWMQHKTRIDIGRKSRRFGSTLNDQLILMLNPIYTNGFPQQNSIPWSISNSLYLWKTSHSWKNVSNFWILWNLRKAQVYPSSWNCNRKSSVFSWNVCCCEKFLVNFSQMAPSNNLVAKKLEDEK